MDLSVSARRLASRLPLQVAFAGLLLAVQVWLPPLSRAEVDAYGRTVVRGGDVLGPVTPVVFSGDLRDLPLAPVWKPGDPIKEIPRRHTHPGPYGPIAPETPAWNLDPLLLLDVRPTRGIDPGFGTPILNVVAQSFTGVTPPDTVGDVGPNHYVHMVNAGGGSSITVHDKTTGAVISGPTILDSLWTTPPGGQCTGGLGDPVVLYDSLADRWLLSEFSSGGNRLCVYISQTPSPVSGGWFLYSFTAPGFPDYPKYGVWPDAYYVSTNESSPAAYAFDRPKMLLGQPATSVRFTAPDLSGFPFQALLPADVDGSVAPPDGAPNPFIRHRDSEVHGPAGNPTVDFLELWDFHVDFVTPGNSTFTGPTTISMTEISSELCGLSSFNCIPQPSGPTLDPLREVVMFRLAYRNRGDHEVLVGNLVSDVDGEPDSPADNERAGIRWFELRKTGGDPWTLFQEGTVAPDDGVKRWMGSIAMDFSGNIALAYNVSSSSVFPGLRYIGRLADDPIGTMPQGEYTLVNGTASNSSNRYGDYAALSVDPSDECTFWFTAEYNPSSQWSTRIGSFRFDNCSVGPTNTPTATVTGTPPTFTPTRTRTPTRTETPTITRTSTRTATNTRTSTNTRTPSRTRTPSQVPGAPTSTFTPTPQNPGQPTFTPTGPVPPTRTSTPVGTDVPAVAQFVTALLEEGATAQATGSSPVGDHLLCVVVNGFYGLGVVYTGPTLNCVDIVGGGAFGPVTVLQSASTGEYDLILFRSASDRTVIAGDRLSDPAGLTVSTALASQREPWVAVIVLAFATILGVKLRRRAHFR